MKNKIRTTLLIKVILCLLTVGFNSFANKNETRIVPVVFDNLQLYQTPYSILSAEISCRNGHTNNDKICSVHKLFFGDNDGIFDDVTFTGGDLKLLMITNIDSLGVYYLQELDEKQLSQCNKNDILNNAMRPKSGVFHTYTDSRITHLYLDPNFFKLNIDYRELSYQIPFHCRSFESTMGN